MAGREGELAAPACQRLSGACPPTYRGQSLSLKQPKREQNVDDLSREFVHTETEYQFEMSISVISDHLMLEFRELRTNCIFLS